MKPKQQQQQQQQQQRILIVTCGAPANLQQLIHAVALS
jgi:hypothetical protein